MCTRVYLYVFVHNSKVSVVMPLDDIDCIYYVHVCVCVWVCVRVCVYVFVHNSKVSVVMDQFLRLLHTCGMPMDDVDFMNCSGTLMEKVCVRQRDRETERQRDRETERQRESPWMMLTLSNCSCLVMKWVCERGCVRDRERERQRERETKREPMDDMDFINRSALLWSRCVFERERQSDRDREPIDDVDLMNCSGPLVEQVCVCICVCVCIRVCVYVCVDV